MERPLGLITIWKINETAPTHEIIKTALFGYYQNAEDYLNEFARAHKWEPEPPGLEGVRYKLQGFAVELNLIQAKGIDLALETYLFPELKNGEKTEA